MGRYNYGHFEEKWKNRSAELPEAMWQHHSGRVDFIKSGTGNFG